MLREQAFCLFILLVLVIALACIVSAGSAPPMRLSAPPNQYFGGAKIGHNIAQYIVPAGA
jgi:hypothetical protein